MFENFFSQRSAYVMRYILEHEQKQEQTFAAGECPNCGHDYTAHSAWIANPGDTTCVEQVIASECDVWDELQAVPSYCERFVVQEQEEMDEFTKTAHFCGECGAVYQWSADDIAWGYEKPFMPCGHIWKFLDKQLPLVAVKEQGEELHTTDRPFCRDMLCPCHHDSVLWRYYIRQPVVDGILTMGEAAAIFSGRQV